MSNTSSHCNKINIIFQSTSMETKVQQLADMANKKPILRFNGNKFREYVKSTPRNYSVIVIFTAMAPSRQCAICRNVHDEFSIVASSFRYSQAYSNELFFVMVDFDEGSDVFQLVSAVYFDIQLLYDHK